jgi:hypothetical protein
MEAIEVLRGIANSTGPGYIQSEHAGRSFKRNTYGAVTPYTSTDRGHLYTGVVLLDYTVLLSKEPQDIVDNIDWRYFGTVTVRDLNNVFNYSYTNNAYKYLLDKVGTIYGSTVYVYGCLPYQSRARGKDYSAKVSVVKLSGGYSLYNLGDTHYRSLYRTRSPIENIRVPDPTLFIDRMHASDGFYSAEDIENGEVLVRTFEVNERTEELNMREYNVRWSGNG